MLAGLTPEEYRNLLLSVGSHKSERVCSPVEVAMIIQRATDAGETRTSVAEALELGPTQVSDFLKLLRVTEDVRDLADWGGDNQSTLPFSTVSQLSRLDPAGQREAAIRVLQEGMTWKEVVELIQIATRSGDPIDSCVERVLQRRPTISRQYVLLGAISDTRVQRALDGLSQRERDELLAEFLTRSLRLGTDRLGWRLGSRMFSVASDVSLAGLTDRSPDEIEVQLVDFLQSSVA